MSEVSAIDDQRHGQIADYLEQFLFVSRSYTCTCGATLKDFDLPKVHEFVDV